MSIFNAFSMLQALLLRFILKMFYLNVVSNEQPCFTYRRVNAFFEQLTSIGVPFPKRLINDIYRALHGCLTSKQTVRFGFLITSTICSATAYTSNRTLYCKTTGCHPVILCCIEILFPGATDEIVCAHWAMDTLEIVPTKKKQWADSSLQLISLTSFTKA